MDFEKAFHRADKQRNNALICALQIILPMAEASLDPDQMENFKDIQKTLLERYKVKDDRLK